MKVRVKYNNEVIDVIQVGTKTHLYDIENVEFLDNPQDYWEKLKHQAAISAMLGMIRTVGHDRMYPPEKIAIYATACATALVEKLKEEK